MRDKMIVVGLIALMALGALLLLTGPKSGAATLGFISEGGGAVQAQVVGENGSFVVSNTPPAASKANSRFPAISQRDKSQYASEDEWKTWAASACSAASVAAVLDGYGKSVRITDVLAFMQQQNAIKAGAGLYRYDVFTTIATSYGLRAVYSEDKDVDSHFQRILGYLKQGYPVVINVLDSTYFPNGHFIVATGLNADGSIAVINPDPVADRSVNQDWPADGLKLYFSRMTRSAVFMPA